MPNAKHYNLYDTTAYWVNKLNGVITSSVEKEMRRFDITPSQWTVLVPLYHGKTDTPQKLAKFIGIDKAAVKRTLDRLEKKGFITRRKDEKDSRLSHIDLTEKGQKVVPQLIIAAQKCDSRFLEGLSNEEAFMFKAIINKMLRSREISAFI